MAKNGIRSRRQRSRQRSISRKMKGGAYSSATTLYPRGVNTKQLRFEMLQANWVKDSTMQKNSKGKIEFDHENFS